MTLDAWILVCIAGGGDSTWDTTGDPYDGDGWHLIYSAESKEIGVGRKHWGGFLIESRARAARTVTWCLTHGLSLRAVGMVN